MPLIALYLISVTLCLTAACFLTLWAPQISKLICELTMYGKTIKNEPSMFVRRLSVPKRYFTHFYLLAVIWTSFLLCTSYAVAIGSFSIPQLVHDWFKEFGSGRVNYSWTEGMVVVTLILLHVLRRCCESLFVSVYSDSTMNIGHYVMGIAHYLLVPLAVLTDTNGWVSERKSSSLVVNLYELSYVQWIGVVFFLWCNYEQNRIAVRLADSRKGPSGLATNYGHSVLYGGWFDLVSSPHFTFEILIYISLWAVLGFKWMVTWKFLVGFVFINQMFAGLITHRWYKVHFKTYPEKRKAIFPFVL